MTHDDQDANIFFTLREANTNRQKEWDPKGQISHSFRGNEVAGELGEALEKILALLELSIAVGRLSNQIKKFDRAQMNLVGGINDTTPIAEELGDVQICLDLVALALGIDLENAAKVKFNKSSVKMGLKTRYV
jgi:NTP pyrophosphatase (non-canonical NTP hydrolase)